MLKRYQHVIGGLFRVTDALVVAAVWLAAYGARFYIPLVAIKGELPEFSIYASLVPLIAILWTLVFSAMGVYESGRLRGRKDEVLLIWQAHLLALGLFLALTYAYDHYRYSRLVMIYFGVFAAVALAAFRVGLRTLLRWVREHGFNLRHVLVVGEGEGLVSVVERIDWYPELGLRVRGLVTRDGLALSRRTSEHVQSKPVVGSYDDIPKLIAEGNIDEILLALPREEQRELTQLLNKIQDETVDIRLLPDVHEYVMFGCKLEHLDGIPIVRLNDAPMMGWGSVGKRSFDIVSSGLALVLLLPFLLLVAAIVKLTSPGPVLYRQERMGLDGRTFSILKFRSMKADADSEAGGRSSWTVPNDDRRTAVGIILRKTSIDELPQLWNVLVGDMSLVGPRPERPIFVHQYRHEIPHYMLRHKVKAGLTGWAQVSGWRGDTSIQNRIECDLYYIKNWSLALDLKIVLMTFWKGFVNKNAY